MGEALSQFIKPEPRILVHEWDLKNLIYGHYLIFRAQCEAIDIVFSRKYVG